MEEIRQFAGIENNDNQLAEVGDWVTIPDDELRKLVANHVGMVVFTVARVEGDIAYLVARTDYKAGMHIPIRPLEMTGDMPPAWGVSRNTLKIEFKPGVVKKE